MNKQIRSIESDIQEAEPRKLKGYAVVFNQKSTPVRTDRGTLYREIIRPQALDKIGERSFIPALCYHSRDDMLARTDEGTLKLKVDTKGVFAEVTEVPDTTFGNNLLEQVRKRNVKGMSFGFIEKDSRCYIEDGELVKEILDLELTEVTYTGYPAYTGTSVVNTRSEQAEPIQEPAKEPDKIDLLAEEALKEVLLDLKRKAELINQIVDLVHTY